jgi:hypothetical protein
VGPGVLVARQPGLRATEGVLRDLTKALKETGPERKGGFPNRTTLYGLTWFKLDARAAASSTSRRSPSPMGPSASATRTAWRVILASKTRRLIRQP